MTITLAEESKPARVTKSGSETFTVQSGKNVTVAYYDPGIVRVLNVDVPAGKTWTVTVNVYVVET